MSATQEILDLYQTDPLGHEWREKIAEFLKNRANLILNTPYCYTLNRTYPVNLLCSTLARLSNAEKQCSLLMPLVREEDIYGNELDKMSLGQFILADDGKSFISLTDIIDTVFSRSTEAEENIYLTTTEDGQQRTLSKTEIQRLGDIYKRLEEIRQQINDRGFIERLMSRNENKLRRELIALRNGLRDGDRDHGGDEMNAGEAANHAIVRFRLYYETLSTDKQTQIKAIAGAGTTLGDLFETIFRDPERARSNGGTDVIYCMQIVGHNLGIIINENAAILDGIRDTKQECLINMKNQLLRDITEKNFLQGVATLTISMQQQLELLFNDIQAIINRHTKNPNSSATLLEMIEFVIRECERNIKNETFGAKFDCYANLLLAIGFEALTFDHRSPEDNELVLQEIFFRISTLSTCSTAMLFAINTPTSVSNFATWLAKSPLMQTLALQPAPTGQFNYVNDYLKHFPQENQRIIHNLTIDFQREREAMERAIVQQAIDEERKRQSRREGSIFNLFYPAAALRNGKPPLTPTQKTVLTARAAAGATLLAYRILM